MGIRIEDDILVGPSWYENLTSHAAVTIKDIEALRGENDGGTCAS